MVIANTSHQLRQVYQLSLKSLMNVYNEVYCNLKQLDICYAIPTHRGTTGGHCRLRAPKSIQPIVTTTRNYVVKQTGVNNANLIIMTSSESRNGSTNASSCSGLYLTSAVTCVLFNTRSVCNKPVTVKEHMIDQKTDLMSMTETKQTKQDCCSQRVNPALLQLHWRVPFYEAWRRCRIVIQVGI